MRRRCRTFFIITASALALCAIGAQGASAIKGTTAFTCEPVIPAPGTAGFSKAHCKNEDKVETKANFEHVEVEQGQTTEITATNEGTGSGTSLTSAWHFKSVVGGIVIELIATGVHAEGTLTNAVDPSLEHYASGEGTVTFTGVAVTTPVKQRLRSGNRSQRPRRADRRRSQQQTEGDHDRAGRRCADRTGGGSSEPCHLQHRQLRRKPCDSGPEQNIHRRRKGPADA